MQFIFASNVNSICDEKQSKSIAINPADSIIWASIYQAVHNTEQAIFNPRVETPS